MKTKIDSIDWEARKWEIVVALVNTRPDASDSWYPEAADKIVKEYQKSLTEEAEKDTRFFPIQKG